MARLLLINPRSGDESPSADELEQEATPRGIQTHRLVGDDDVARLAEAAAATVLGVAGGDGSLSPVAAVAIERDLPFVCIPFGTRNHFARDLGLDRDDPIGALAAFDGEERRIDVGSVNGRVFLNNVSLGSYASLVHRRERHRRRGEALARLRALSRVARARHRLHVRIDGDWLVVRVLLVANNAYDLSLFTLGERPALDTSRLHLYAAAGWLPTRWEERRAAEFELDLQANKTAAAADGEPIVLEPPLRFEVRPRALRVLVPRAPQ